MSKRQPNILLIQADQWRGDCLGCDGHPVVETPHLDTMAFGGSRFTRAYTPVPSCIAARASLMTGLRPKTHGRVGYRDGVPWRYETTLAGTLAAAGYQTQAVGKMHVFPERSLLGFHHVLLHDGYLHHSRSRRGHEDRDDYLPWLRERRGGSADYVDTGIGCNSYVVAPWCYDTMEHPSAWVASQSVDFLRRRDMDKPFFLYTSFHRPHPPLDPPRDYLAFYEDKELPALPSGDWIGDLLQNRGLDSPVPHRQAEIDRARRAYYAQITFIDHQINRLFHALHERNLLDNTWILFSSDHGDMLFDHQCIAKAVPYEGSTRIPFIVRPPHGTAGFESNHTVDAPIELADVFPTCCDIAGIPIPEAIEGRSVLPFCRGESPDWRNFLHGEHSWGVGSNHWLTDGKWKYVWFSQTGCEQLFDLLSDPSECREVAAAHPERLRTWRQRLIQELSGREEGYSDGNQLIAGQPPAEVLKHIL